MRKSFDFVCALGPIHLSFGFADRGKSLSLKWFVCHHRPFVLTQEVPYFAILITSLTRCWTFFSNVKPLTSAVCTFERLNGWSKLLLQWQSGHPGSGLVDVCRWYSGACSHNAGDGCCHAGAGYGQDCCCVGCGHCCRLFL